MSNGAEAIMLHTGIIAFFTPAIQMTALSCTVSIQAFDGKIRTGRERPLADITWVVHYERKNGVIAC
jgi:hypothetical protein